MKRSQQFLPTEGEKHQKPLQAVIVGNRGFCYKTRHTNFTSMRTRKRLRRISRPSPAACLSSGRSLLVKLAVACIALFLNQSSHAQNSPATLPNAQISRGGLVRAIAVQDDGKIIIGGEFTSVNGVRRDNIARINVDGSVDETWNPGVPSYDSLLSIRGLAVAGTNLFVAGPFFLVNGVRREGLAKLSLVDHGSVDPHWNPHLWAGQFVPWPSALAISGDALFVGGIGFLAKVSATGTGAVNTIWDPTVQPGCSVHALAVSGTNLYVGGYFTRVGEIIREMGLAKLAIETGEFDTNWNPGVVSPPTSGFPGISVLTLKGDDLYIGGSFISVGGQNRTNLAKLDAYGTGALDANWAPNPSSTTNYSDVLALAITGSDIYVGGRFTSVAGQSRTNLVRLSTTGTGMPDPYWDPQPQSDPYSASDFGVAAIVTDGAKVYVGGDFIRMRSKTALGLARLGSLTGLRDDGFPVQVELPGYVLAIARQPDGKIIIGGWFELVGRIGRNGLARFNLDGSVDSTWDPDPDNPVTAIAVSKGDIFVAGLFSRIGGMERRGLAKINAAGRGSADPVWNPTPPEAPRLLAVSGTNLYAADLDFFHLTYPIAKLSTTGSGQTDPAWNPTNLVGDKRVEDLHQMIATETAVFITGYFSALGRTNNQWGIAKLISSLGGNADTSWNPASLGGVGTFALNGTNLYGTSDGSLVKLITEGTGDPDPLWNPRLENASYVRVLGATETHLYVWGCFTNTSGECVDRIVRVALNGTGELDPTWSFPIEWVPERLLPVFTASFESFLAVGRDAYLGWQGFAFFPIADPPVMVKLSATNLVILRNPEDSYEVTHFQITEITGGTLYQSDGQSRIDPGDFITVQQGEAGLVFEGAINGTVTAVSALNETSDGAGTAAATLDLSAPQRPAFSLSAAEYRVAENSNAVRITVRKLGEGPASVNIVTANGLAITYDYDSDTGDYYAIDLPTALSFPSWPTNKSFFVSIHDDAAFEGDESFWLILTNATGRLAYPATASAVIIDNEPFGSTESFTTNRVPDQAPSPESLGGLQVYLEPGFGQWRLAGELDWRNSGDLVSNLVATVYEMEFKPLINYYELDNVQVAIRAGTNLPVPLSYQARPGSSMGSLSVGLTPIDVILPANETNRGQWRVLSEVGGVWHDSGQTVSNLSAGLHIVQFKNIANYAAPTDREVTVLGGSTSTLSVPYFAVGDSKAMTPHVLSFSEVTDANWPYQYNGQIQTDAGFSSGVVVKERVVLAVAHGLFNDFLLDWVPGARWFFQKHGSDYRAPPQIPRGWYVLAGYAAQRTNDILNGASPGSSTRASQQLDAAALYFVEAEYDANRPGRGGYGGYLSSNAGLDNEHFLNDGNKMLVGYPFDPKATVNWGKLHATVPTNLAFRFLNPNVFVTEGIRSFPGNSGGPLYVQWTNGQYYPAGIYLGGVAETLVRVIDSAVVDLINRAEASGSDGGNHGGGGVIRIDRGSSSSGSWKLIMRLGPAAAVQAGAKWRGGTLSAFTTGNVDFDFCQAEQTIQTVVEFTSVPGWRLPTYSTNVNLRCGQTTTIEAIYDVDPPRLIFDYQGALRLFATTGTTYQIETNSNLGRPTSWGRFLTISPNAIPVVLTNARPTNTGQLFYRARWIP